MRQCSSACCFFSYAQRAMTKRPANGWCLMEYHMAKCFCEDSEAALSQTCHFDVFPNPVELVSIHKFHFL